MSKSVGDFCVGMYVRAPRDFEETPIEGEYRDYWLGQIIELDKAEKAAVVQFLQPFGDHQMQSLKERYGLELLARAAIAPRARFIERTLRQWGCVLMPCETDETPGKLRAYFVQIADVVLKIDEKDIYVTYSDQAPAPTQQLYNYEFQHPLWQTRRDSLIKSYAALQTATYGIEELVGARILLLAHQAEVIARVLGDTQVRYLLADEVGLGKTIEACVILKGLMRRHPNLKTLILVPPHLLQQWYYELDFKFWIRLKRVSSPTGDFEVKPPGLIVSHKSLVERDDLWRWLSHQAWDLLIVDEAHHALHNPALSDRIYALSEKAARALVLSATPVEHRAQEYLGLLKLVNPDHYGSLSEQTFARMVEAQAKIRDTLTYHTRALTSSPDDFDSAEFQRDLQGILQSLHGDTTLAELAQRIDSATADGGVAAAREALQYVAENYRIESRVIRNRRANLEIDLPVRQVSEAYSYQPALAETNTLEALHDYAARILRVRPNDADSIRLCQQLFHAAFSSPSALIPLLNKAPSVGLSFKEQVIRYAEQWDAESAALLDNVARGMALHDAPDRLARVLSVIQDAVREPKSKVLVFTSWEATLERLRKALLKHHKRHTIAVFKDGMSSLELQAEADRFQADPTCRILLCDESGGEGRNFQIAQQIIHVDLPWSPARVEQRIGRVDRIGRTGIVLSIVPFAQDTLEHDLFRLWQDAFRLFEQSISGLEIVFEEIQDQLYESFAASTREGLASLLPQWSREAEHLRDQVEEERYFEQGTIDYRRRREFQELSNQYDDGEAIRRPLLRWAEMMGLPHHYYPQLRLARFDPQEVNREHLRNAKLADAPSMAEALRRSRDPNARILEGTFHRTFAVRRENIIFFAPGEDWIDMILNHALQADRGGCSAVWRTSTEVRQEWCGFQFLFRWMIDPRPLFANGHDPTHLLRAQGYLASNIKHVLVTVDGEIVKAADPIVTVLQQPLSKKDKHLGQRGGAAHLLKFKRKYPSKAWHGIVERALDVAAGAIRHDLDSMQALASQAREDFALAASAQRAVNRWRYGMKFRDGQREIQEFEQISEALVEGIAQPLCQLESVRFWIVRPGVRRG